MIDELTGLEVPPEIAAATVEAMQNAANKLSADHKNVDARQPSQCPPPEPTQPAPSALIPFDEFERRIRVLRENGVRAYQDNLIKVQIDTFKRQPDPVPLAHETQST